MCGRAYETYTEEELAVQFLNRRPLRLEGFRPTYNLAPTQQAPVVFVRDGEPTIDLLRWGLVPFWARSLEAVARYSLINARGEEIVDKRSYARAFRSRRCIVPLSGFYEWRRDGKRKRPFAIHLRDRPIMPVAGVWECWQPKDAPTPLLSFAVVTTRANPRMAEIHDRMPVILADDEIAHWLDPEVHEPERLLPLIRPCPSEWLTAYEVSTAVNSPSHDSPDLLKPMTGSH